MNFRRIVAGSVLLAVSAVGITAFAQRLSPTPRAEPSSPVMVLDAHEDCLRRVLDRGDDLSDPDWGGQVDIPKWRNGGVNIVWFAAWVDPRKYQGEAATRRARALMGALHEQIAQHPRDLALCDSAADCRKAAGAGQIAALIGIEGGIAINNDLALIGEFRREHVRRMNLTWRGDLAWAGSSQALDESAVRRPKGLSDFGREVVREMNRAGMVADLSHASEQTCNDVFDVSTLPVIFSHSNVRELADHPRNVSDDVLRRLKENGGVIGVNFHRRFLQHSGSRGLLGKLKAMDVNTVASHIEHIRDVAGVDHVGIGSDWDGDIRPVSGLETAAELGNLLKALERRGFTEGEIRKIAGENFLRVLEANDRTRQQPSVSR